MTACTCDSLTFIDIITHTKCYLECFIQHHGKLTYFLICTIIFCETGLVATPFLPGDSLLFTAGLFAHVFPDILNLYALIALLILAAITGDNVNYFVGHYFGVKVFDMKLFKTLVKREYLTRTELFYEQHGGKTIILARFVPIVRTFAPFAAGMGGMHYGRYLIFCFGGAFIWVTSLCLAGYFLGTHPFIQQNYEKVVLGIVFLSLIPVIIGMIKSRRRAS